MGRGLETVSPHAGQGVRMNKGVSITAPSSCTISQQYNKTLRPPPEKQIPE